MEIQSLLFTFLLVYGNKTLHCVFYSDELQMHSGRS